MEQNLFAEPKHNTPTSSTVYIITLDLKTNYKSVQLFESYDVRFKDTR